MALCLPSQTPFPDVSSFLIHAPSAPFLSVFLFFLHPSQPPFPSPSVTLSSCPFHKSLCILAHSTRVTSVSPQLLFSRQKPRFSSFSPYFSKRQKSVSHLTTLLCTLSQPSFSPHSFSIRFLAVSISDSYCFLFWSTCSLTLPPVVCFETGSCFVSQVHMFFQSILRPL